MHLELFTHSSEQTYRLCPRRFELSYRLGLRPSHDGDALRVGHAVHTGLETMKNGGSEDESSEAVHSLYANAVCPPWLDADAFAVEEETAAAIVRGYFRRWHGSPVLKYLAVEIGFDLPIVNPYTGRESNYRTAGKIDGIAELPDGRIALVEHKTSGDDITLGSEYWQRLMMDHQISRYVLAARQLGYNVETTVFDVIRKPSIKPKAVSKADRQFATSRGNYHGLTLGATCPERETPRMYGARLAADMEERPEFYFARNEVPRLDADLEAFALDQWHTLKAMTQAEVDGYWPRNTAACLIYGRCPYFDVCRGLCGDPHEQTPNGFKRVDDVHPELNRQAPAEGPAARETV